MDYLPELSALSQKLTETESQMSAFFHLCPLLFVVASKSGNFIKVNQAWERLFGFTSEEMAAQPWLFFVHPNDVQKTIEIAKTMDEDRVERFCNRFRMKDGGYRMVRWLASRWIDQNVAFCVAEDITDRLKAAGVEV